VALVARASRIEIDTPHGPAQAELRPVDEPKGALVLGHGAGGGIEAPDLMAATAAANEIGFTVALVLQPYLVAGKRSSPAPGRLDEAWVVAMQHLGADALGGLPLITGGRSAGARVACRTAAASGAAAVLCLAFPVHPPGKPEKSRIDELDAVELPVLVVQGESDPFGMPPDAPGREVVRIRGNHGLKTDLEAVGDAVRRWLPTVVA
jgi:predicted alpha/beta-hydrolase family hydrolase